MSDADRVDACPDCGSSRLSANATGGMRGRDTRGRFRCIDCKSYFDECDERARREDRQTRKGLAGELVEADPDEVSS